MNQYIRAHALKVSHHIKIRISAHSKAQAVQVLVPLGIFGLAVLFTMLRTVELYDKLCPRTIEIHYAAAYDLLTVESDRLELQKIIPQPAFFFCHIFTQLLREFGKFGIVAVHRSPRFFHLIRRASATPSPQGEGNGNSFYSSGRQYSLPPRFGGK